MDVLVIAATEAEIKPFLGLPVQRRQGMDTLITGVGMVATALALGERLASTRYDLLLNVGVAGSFDRAIQLGEVVWVVEDIFSELGVEDGERFIDSEAAGLTPCTFYSRYSHPSVENLRSCKGITVNTVHGNDAAIKAVVERLSADVESMEGAAVFQAAQHFGIPALQVRAISNYVERRNKASWQLAQAVENLNRWLMNFTRNMEWPEHRLNTKI
ncbi:MAG TPA: futalosine hydrolase [Parapedobacter sp.]|uniref:futalosine hydrolase n=1 Tax=Parapedobacter sp. TaxID=1958893 RepID=UPI002C82452C|nr:futalosine hydrolase [Parapedobacter sp.]HWK58831.1 futalosine hydrolase [Parapedobacter sp.]